MRASGYCLPNEILIDETVRHFVFRDFDVRPVDVNERSAEHRPKNMEESFTLYVLGELKPEVTAESEAPGHFVYTLGAIGKGEEAAAVAQRGGEHLIDAATGRSGPRDVLQRRLRSWNKLVSNLRDYSTAIDMLRDGLAVGFSPDVTTYNMLVSKAPNFDAAKDWMETMRRDGIWPDVDTYNALLDKAPDYDVAKGMLGIMRREGVEPDIITYHKLIEKAPDCEVAKSLIETMRRGGIEPDVATWNKLTDKAPTCDVARGLVETMRQEGIEPDMVTYNKVVEKAPDYESAKSLIETMRQEGIEADVATYNKLVEKAPDYESAKSLIETMRQEGVEPDTVTYGLLFGKDLSGKSADEILNWYLAQAYHPEGSIQAAIATYRKAGRIDDALRMALEYPDLEAARKLIRDHDEEAVTYFKSISTQEPKHPNADYALGVALMELGRTTEARPHLRRASRTVRHGPRRTIIDDWLHQIGSYLKGDE